MVKKLTVGILAHVDAGKTTLSEALLYCSGSVRRLGRVDRGDAFLDHEALERKRGITIFSKQARFSLPNAEITLLDTPGHVDFSTEMERTLSVLDYAILVISGTDGIQSHTETLWHLLKRYRIPTFLFVNKMDLDGAAHDSLLEALRQRLSAQCVDMNTPEEERMESVSLCDDALLDAFLSKNSLSDGQIAASIANRKVFPCYFGSALKLDGVDDILQDLSRLTQMPDYPAEFGARVYKIARDPLGARLTYLKVTGGTLSVKDLLQSKSTDSADTEKVDQIRLYSGTKYSTADSVSAGSICAVTGLSHTNPGQGLGFESALEPPVLQPVMAYQMFLPPDCNLPETLRRLRQLEEEDPALSILWDERLQEIRVHLMGVVQLEILQSLILERFGLEVCFGAPSVLYKETILAPVIGVGHFEPLRHYAEVHLLLEPGERGSGLLFDSRCSLDVLDVNWQRLILTHLEEKTHPGALAGAPITDMRITLLTGRAHLKHTQGGDFRQATYRAVRQGLRCAESVLLEPYYNFTLHVPVTNLRRAMSEIQQRFGVCDAPVQAGETAVLTGYAPVATLQDYPAVLAAYTKGKGQLRCTVRGYAPCHNTKDVLEKLHYDPDMDVENTADSVFCAHGAGFLVPWNEAPKRMHLESELPAEKPVLPDPAPEAAEPAPKRFGSAVSRSYRGTRAQDEELQAIFERTYGTGKPRSFAPRRPAAVQETAPPQKAAVLSGPEYLLVDGYNIIFAWESLSTLARASLDGARQTLADILANYRGFRKCQIILVFDAYKVPGNPGSVEKYNNIDIVYTKEAETADAYIEKVSYQLSGKYRVRVATSDNLEQMIILGHGAQRVSAEAFLQEIEQTQTEIADILERYREKTQKSTTVRQIIEQKNT